MDFIVQSTVSTLSPPVIISQFPRPSPVQNLSFSGADRTPTGTPVFDRSPAATSTHVQVTQLQLLQARQRKFGAMVEWDTSVFDGDSAQS